MAPRELLAELASRYQRASAQAVATEAAGGVDVAKRVQAGEAVDVVVLASDAIDRLMAGSRLIAGSRVDLFRSPIAAAVKAGNVAPDL